MCVEGRVYDTAGGGPLRGWTVSLQDVGGQVRTLRSAANGVYRFSNLTVGVYTVSLRVEPGWRAVSPESSTVTVAPADLCVGVDFWNERAASEGSSAPPPPAAPNTTAVRSP